MDHQRVGGLVAFSAGILLCFFGLAPNAPALPIVNINFDSQTIGDAPTTDGIIGTPAAPETNIYSSGGFPDNGAYTATIAVANVKGLTKAAQMTTTQAGTAAQYMDTQFVAGSASRIAVDFDLNVIDIPTTGLPQATPTATNGQAFVVQGLGNSDAGPLRAFRFAVSPTGATTGFFGLRHNTDSDLRSIGSYTENSNHHIELILDYPTQSLTALVDGNPAATNVPFVDAGGANGNLTDLEELFISQNDVEGQTNNVAIDNIIVNTPEPASLGWIAVAASVILRRRLRT